MDEHIFQYCLAASLNFALKCFPLSSVWSNIVCLFSHRMVYVTNTVLDENVGLFSRGFSAVGIQRFIKFDGVV